MKTDRLGHDSYSCAHAPEHRPRCQLTEQTHLAFAALNRARDRHHVVDFPAPVGPARSTISPGYPR